MPATCKTRLNWKPGFLHGNRSHFLVGWTTTGWPLDQGKEVVVSPSEYALCSVYPNPFNPTTTILVNLPAKSHLNVCVFNTVGQQVGLLAHSGYSAGQHQFTFDGSDLASGVYFVQVEVPGELSAMKKIVLMK